MYFFGAGRAKINMELLKIGVPSSRCYTGSICWELREVPDREKKDALRGT